MRQISCQTLTRAVADLCIRANTQLPPPLCQALDRAREQEVSPTGRAILSDLADNFTLAAQHGLPICQDTGLAEVFAQVGQEVHITGGGFQEAIDAGVALGYREGGLRCSVVGDPLRRVNTGDNTPALVHLRLVPGDSVCLTVAPKGFGSENMTRLCMFTPSATREDILGFITASVSQAGANPCPPLLIGVGLGGTAQHCLLLAKEALLLPPEEPNPDPLYAALEEEALSRINALGIGPQGLGGSSTALGVSILAAPTHIAGLPCGVALGCHATRYARAVL